MTMGSNAEIFFEGAEKLLEVWFASDSPDENRSLRTVPRWQWEELLDIAHCRICSHQSNDYMDAYVLSESSMFVSDCRFILKTCGSTSLLHTVKPLLDIAEKFCGLNKVQKFFYSRKNFMRPELQPEPHVNFEDEIAHLDELFENGAGYCLGRWNQDRWHLYTVNNDTTPEGSIKFPDQTLEICMSELDQEVMSIFTTTTCTNGQEATKLSGIDKLLPRGTVIDDKLFEPHGYSMNALVGNTDQYATIHITPEAEFSYVSFETNLAQSCYFELIKRVLYCFRPGKFMLTVFANKDSGLGQKGQKDVWEKNIPGYKRVDTQILMLADETVAYVSYVRT